jgi:hypothetical protein
MSPSKSNKCNISGFTSSIGTTSGTYHRKDPSSNISPSKSTDGGFNLEMTGGSYYNRGYETCKGGSRKINL